MRRIPHNKGAVEFPAVLHVRCTSAMVGAVRDRGGSRWVRALLTANLRPPTFPEPAGKVIRGLAGPGDTRCAGNCLKIKGHVGKHYFGRRVSRKTIAQPLTRRRPKK